MGIDLREAVKAFYPDSGGGGFGREICRECEVRCDCLAWSIREEEWGVWGGETGLARNRMRRDIAEGYVTLQEILIARNCHT